MLSRLREAGVSGLIFSACFAGAAHGSDVSAQLVKFERVNEISVSDFWDLSPATVISSKENAVIGYWPFDYDAIAQEEGWRLIGIVGAGLLDLGETPVVAKVYARRDVYFLADESEALTLQSHDSAFAVFGMSPNRCRKEPTEHCGKRVTFSVDENNVVLGGEDEIGVVED